MHERVPEGLKCEVCERKFELRDRVIRTPVWIFEWEDFSSPLKQLIDNEEDKKLYIYKDCLIQGLKHR